MKKETLNEATVLDVRIKHLQTLITKLKNERESLSTKIYEIEHYSPYKDILETTMLTTVAIVIKQAENELEEITDEFDKL